MDSSPKISFNQQLVSQGREPSKATNSGYTISPYKRILSIVKDGNPNGLRSFLGSLDNASQYVNQIDKDLLQTPLYQAVQIKNKTIGFSLTNILLQFGVRLIRPKFFLKIFMDNPHCFIFVEMEI